MSRNPYQRFAQDKLILRDQLAIDRTILANERTFLAYVRTALAFALTGAGCLKFFTHPLMHVLGVALMVLGAGIGVMGVYRFQTLNRQMSCVIRKTETGFEARTPGEGTATEP